jgi:hypothetical protein
MSRLSRRFCGINYVKRFDNPPPGPATQFKSLLGRSHFQSVDQPAEGSSMIMFTRNSFLSGAISSQSTLVYSALVALVAVSLLASCAMPAVNTESQGTPQPTVKTLSADEIALRLNRLPQPERLVCRTRCYVRLCNLPPKPNPIDCGLICEEVCECKPGSPC